jgi:hypothetical protein
MEARDQFQHGTGSFKQPKDYPLPPSVNQSHDI